MLLRVLLRIHDFLRQQFLVNGELEWRYRNGGGKGVVGDKVTC